MSLTLARSEREQNLLTHASLTGLEKIIKELRWRKGE